MSYLPTYQPVGLTEEEERWVEYELPRVQHELEKARFEHERKQAKWDRLQTIATVLIPTLAFFGWTSWRRLKREVK